MIRHDTDLRHALSGVPLSSWTGPLHRSVAGRYLRSLASVRGSLKADNRYTRAGTCAALYTSHYPDLALLEVMQGSTFNEAFPGATSAVHVTFNVRVDLTDVLDLTHGDVQEALETNLQELTGEWKAMNARGLDAPTQRLGRIAFESRQVQAIRYPSRVQPHRANMLIFKDRVSTPLVPAGLPRDFPDQEPL
ncbi:RES family NAD+ phosphorylase [Deinococcus pimensis]|uniref:RES family NAD+ phosphorylase n=1 Tax=Deinococcus pimensis TaxID=309888 RepID=UPI0004869886|nr:RES family NAD+ phosphorylase [Deinococcus pimensis]